MTAWRGTVAEQSVYLHQDLPDIETRDQRDQKLFVDL